MFEWSSPEVPRFFPAWRTHFCYSQLPRQYVLVFAPDGSCWLYTTVGGGSVLSIFLPSCLDLWGEAVK